MQQGSLTKVVGSGNVPTGGDSEGKQEGQAGAGGWKVGDGPGRENTQGKRPELRRTWHVFRFLRSTSSVELEQSLVGGRRCRAQKSGL